MRNDLIQKSRHGLTAYEYKCILYMISLVKPDDKPGKIYRFNCSDVMLVTKTKNESYTKFKRMLTSIGQKVWWMDIDEHTEAMLRWFDIVHMSKGTGEVAISFHKDIFPYILGLSKQKMENGEYFTAYQLQCVALMRHQYSARLYNLLKSYQYNNVLWVFEIGTGSAHDLQRRLSDIDDKGRQVMPASWKNWSIFNRDVLKPAVEDINLYTDIKVIYEPSKIDLSGKKHRGYAAVKFTMLPKTQGEMEDTEHVIDAEYDEVEDEKYEQVSLFDFSPEEKEFISRHEEKEGKERIVKELEKAAERQRTEREAEEAAADERWARIEKSAYPILTECLPEFSNDQIGAIARTANLHFRGFSSDFDMWCADYVRYYYDYLKATPEETKTTNIKRLLNLLKNDYHEIAENLNQKYNNKGQKYTNIDERYNSYIDLLKKE